MKELCSGIMFVVDGIQMCFIEDHRHYMNNFIHRTIDIPNRSLDVSAKQERRCPGTLTGLSFWLPFVCCGTVFAAMPIIHLIEHPSKHVLPDLIAAVFVGYSTMGTSFGLAGLVVLSMFRSTAKLIRGKDGEV